MTARLQSPRAGVLPLHHGAGMILRPIEDVAYRLKPGEVFPAAPSATRYGYFIVKLLAREPRVCRARPATSFCPSWRGILPPRLQTADSLMELLRAGADFCRNSPAQHSIDKVTAERGGELGKLVQPLPGLLKTIQSRLLPEFERRPSSACAMESWGKRSSPPSASHIIRRDSTKALQPPRRSGKTLRRLYRRALLR
jgi:hypothetical protein